jgi:signal transduction histidine kinase
MKNSGFITSRIYSDAEGRKTLSKMLKTMLIVAIVLIPLLLILRFINYHSLSPTDAALGLLLAAFAGCYFLLKKGNLLSVSIFFIIAGWIAMTFMAARSAGIRDVSIIGYILLIFLATLFIGYRFSIIIAVLSLISSWIMAIAEHEAILIPYKDLPLEYARDFTVFLVLFTTTIVIFETSFRYSMNRINKELQDRIKAEQKLSANEKRLIENNEELLKAKLKAEESDRLKTAFLQNISHEIRTPMNGIIGYSELIQDNDTDDSKRKEYFSEMSVCTFQLASLVNDLIDISKIEAGDIQLKISEFTPADLIGSTRNLFSDSAAEKELDLLLEDETGNLAIRSDREKLSQILNNLVSNSIKFTSAGSVNVKMKRNKNCFEVSVSDTGIGISNDNLGIIFDRFRQAEMGLSRPYGGTGLGLAIVNGLVKFMHGTITVQSEPGAGSLFRVSIPVEFLASAV